MKPRETGTETRQNSRAVLGQCLHKKYNELAEMGGAHGTKYTGEGMYWSYNKYSPSLDVNELRWVSTGLKPVSMTDG